MDHTLNMYFDCFLFNLNVSGHLLQVGEARLQVVKRSDSNSPRFKSNCCRKVWSVSFTPHSSFNCVNEYLTIDSGGCM